MSSPDPDIPMTQALRVLKQHGAAFTPCVYDYEEHGGTRRAAACPGVDGHAVVKTLVMEDDRRRPLVVLMHGDCEVSARQLARQLGVKTIQPCTPENARRHSGYMVGGISPFGLRKPLPVYVESTIMDLPAIYINGGRRGLLVKISPAVLDAVVQVTRVQVAVPPA